MAPVALADPPKTRNTPMPSLPADPRPLRILAVLGESPDDRRHHRSFHPFEQVVDGLAAHGHHLTVLAPSGALDHLHLAISRREVLGENCWSPFPRLCSLRTKVAQLLQSEPVDLVHAFGLWSAGAALGGFKSPSYRLIIHCDGADVALARRNPLARMLMARAARVATALVCPTRHVRAGLYQLFHRTAVVLPFEDSFAGVSIATAPRSLHGRSVLLAAIGNAPGKEGRLRVLFEALHEVAHLHPLALHLLGDPADFPAWQALAESMGLRQLVTLVPEGTLAPEWLAQTHVYLQLGYNGEEERELPRALRDAILVGKPVIFASNEATRDLFAHMQTGLQIDSADASSIEEALLFILDRPYMARVMGQNAREFLLWYLDPERLVRELESLYRSFALPALDSLRFLALVPAGATAN